MKMQPGLRSHASGDGVAPLLRVHALRASRHPLLRRAGFVVPVALLPALGTALAVVATSGAHDALRWPLLALLGLNLLYMALTGWPGVLGLLVRWSGGALRVHAQPSGRSRTALVMPIYNEDPASVFAAMGAMARAIGAARLRGVDLFVLSDTRDPAIAAQEKAEFTALQEAIPVGPVVHYRRRAVNARRKVGNIAEFCARWGAEYDYMVVLDADSLMAPSAISTLIGLMDSNPRVGIIQSVPYPVGRETPFARLQQFAARLYTPPLAEGLTWWQQGDGNYWGHNAIVRIAPFVQHCDLPVLPGREPWGGEILCHDVVEAVLMRAAGYAVWVLPEVLESYEALPANLVDYAARERRWCQGNLQHTALLRRPGLRPVGRFHLGYGVLHYLAAPVAAGFLALATADLWLGGTTMAALRPGAGRAAAGLIALTAFLLYGAKLLALGDALRDPQQARLYGGRARLLASAAVEQLAAFVTSPILLVFYVRYVAALLAGQAVRWDAQPRDDRGVSWGEAWRRMRVPFTVGAAWLALLLPFGAVWLLWAAPLLLGLLLAAPAAVLSSRAGLGRALRRAGLLVTPEEARPAAIVRAARAPVATQDAGPYPSSVAASVSAAAIRRGTSGLVQT
jgi:membrane glycosyltransferase